MKKSNIRKVIKLLREKGCKITCKIKEEVIEELGNASTRESTEEIFTSTIDKSILDDMENQIRKSGCYPIVKKKGV